MGGENREVEETMYLANIVGKVTLIHRRDSLRAEKMLIDHLMEKSKSKGNIDFAWNSVIDEILGDATGVTGVRIKDVNNEKKREIPVTGVFIAIGHHPNTSIFKGQLDMDATGYLKVKSGTAQFATATNIKGVFAAGDVYDPAYRQAITAAGSGCMAALDADKYLAGVC